MKRKIIAVFSVILIFSMVFIMDTFVFAKGLNDSGDQDYVAVTGVTLDKESMLMLVGQAYPVVATVTPEDATDKTVTFKSSDPEVAEVDSEGMVTAKGVGEAKITATTKDGNKKSSCNIVVKDFIRHTTVELSETSVPYTGKPIEPKVTVKDGDKILKEGKDYIILCYSSNIDAGRAKIAIRGKGFYSGRKYTYFRITRADNTMTVQPTKQTFLQSTLKKSKAQFAISVKKAKGEVTFKLDAAAKKAGLKVSAKGKVTIPKNCKAGTYNITVRAAGNQNYRVGKKTITINVI